MTVSGFVQGRREFPAPFDTLEVKHSFWRRYFEGELHPNILTFERAMKGVQLCSLATGERFSEGEYAGLRWERIGSGLSLDSIRLCYNIDAAKPEPTGSGSWHVSSYKIAPEKAWRFALAQRADGTTLKLNPLNDLVSQIEKNYRIFRAHQVDLLKAIENCNIMIQKKKMRVFYTKHQSLCANKLFKVEMSIPFKSEIIKLQKLPVLILVTEKGDIPFNLVNRIAVD